MPALYAPIIAMLLGARLSRRRLRVPLARPGAASACGTGRSPAARLSPRSRRASRSARWCRASRSTDRAYAGGWWDWLTPFSILTGVALVVGYALLGATWLVLKTEGELQDRALRLGAGCRRSRTLALIGVVSLWTPFLEPGLHAALVRLAAHPLHRAGAAAGARLAASCCSAGLGRAARAASRSSPRWRCSCCAISGSASASIPTSCRRRITIWEAAAPRRQPELPAGRRRRAGAADPCLHRASPTGCSAARSSGRRLSLTAHNDTSPLWRRLAWFAALWLAGVATVALVALVLRKVLLV